MLYELSAHARSVNDSVVLPSASPFQFVNISVSVICSVKILLMCHSIGCLSPLWSPSGLMAVMTKPCPPPTLERWWQALTNAGCATPSLIYGMCISLFWIQTEFKSSCSFNNFCHTSSLSCLCRCETVHAFQRDMQIHFWYIEYMCVCVCVYIYIYILLIGKLILYFIILFCLFENLLTYYQAALYNNILF